MIVYGVTYDDLYPDKSSIATVPVESIVNILDDGTSTLLYDRASCTLYKVTSINTIIEA